MYAKRAIIAGLLCLDVIPDLSAVSEGQFQHRFQPGHLMRTGGVRSIPGGAVANTGLALHRLGIPVRLVGKIGDDLFGQVLQDALGEVSPHLAADLVIDPGQSTGVTIVIDPPGVDRSFLQHPGVNDTFYASDLPPEILESVDLFHFGYPPLMRSIYRGEGAELASILGRARRAGLTTALDFSLPDLSSGPAARLDWLAILDNTLPLVDLFVPSLEELIFLLDRKLFDQHCAKPDLSLIEAIEPSRLEGLADRILRYGVKALLVKLGPRGIYLRTAPSNRWKKCGRGLEHLGEDWHDRQIWAPAFAVTEKSRTGAGDAAIAGFLAGILRGASPEQALRMAVATGAHCVETPGGMAELAGWDQIGSRIERGWETVPLDLAPYGWSEGRAQGVWIKPPSHTTNSSSITR